MSYRRLAILAMAGAAMVAGHAEPGRALLTYSAETERAVTAHVKYGAGDKLIEVTIEGIETTGVTGSDASAPTDTSTSSACITFTRANDPGSTKTVCGPADVDISPALDTATVVGKIQGIDFSVLFNATGAPQAALEPAATSSSLTLSRAGSASAELIGDVFDDPQVEWSSWYAEAKEKAKTSTSQ